VLEITPNTFSLVYAHQLPGFVAQACLFYQDYRRTYLLPHYRFTYTLQKAQQLCGEVKSLGSALLSATGPYE